MKHNLENNADMDSYSDSYRLKIEELRRMLQLYSDILHHVRCELLWEDAEIDITYWEDALSSPAKIDDFDEDLRDIKEQMRSMIEQAFQICGYEKDFRTGEYRKLGTELEE